MEPNHDTLRDRLLAQVEPDPDRLARYREEVRAMLELHEKVLRRQAWYAAAIWLFAVFLMTGFMVVGGMSGKVPNWIMPYLMGFVILIYAAVEMLKFVLNRYRVELLKELKGLELQVRELKDQLAR